MKSKTSAFQLGISCCQLELNNYLTHFLHMSLTDALQQKYDVLHATIFLLRELQNI